MEREREVREERGSKEFLLITSFYYKRAKAAHKQTQKKNSTFPLFPFSLAPFAVVPLLTKSRKCIKKVVKISRNAGKEGVGQV